MTITDLTTGSLQTPCLGTLLQVDPEERAEYNTTFGLAFARSRSRFLSLVIVSSLWQKWIDFSLDFYTSRDK
jgi:hypothetical protein